MLESNTLLQEFKKKIKKIKVFSFSVLIFSALKLIFLNFLKNLLNYYYFIEAFNSC